MLNKPHNLPLEPRVELNIQLRKDGVVQIEGRNYLFTRLLDDGRFAFEDEENARRRVMTQTTFARMYDQSKIVVRDWSALPRKIKDLPERSIVSFPAKTISEAEWRHAYCVAYDANPVPKTEPSMNELIARVAEEHKHTKRPNWKTVTTWLRSRGVKNRRALNTMRSFHELKGRKRGVDSEAEEIIQDAIKYVYLNRQMLPQSAVVEAVIGLINRRNFALPRESWIPQPSPSTVFRRIAEHPLYKTLRFRLGRKAADQLMKPLQRAPEATRPLETMIIDHTKIDGWFLFDDKTKLPCGGRPWLTIAIDAYSRYPLGFYIGFEPPSVYSVMMCLRQAIAPKTELFDKFPDIPADWRALGLPMKLVADNAKEIVGHSLPHACAQLAIELETSPVRTPKYKGVIERFFRTLNTRFLHRLPGTTYGSPKILKDNEITPQNNMSMSFDMFQYLFLKWLTQDYCKSPNRNLGGIPEDLWIKGTELHRVYMPDRVDDLRIALSRQARGTLTREGIRYNNLRYRNPKTINEVLESGKHQSVEVDFYYDPTNLARIHVLSPSGQPLYMTCDDEYAHGISLWQHKIIQDANRKRDRDPKRHADLMQTRFELMEEVHEGIRTGIAKAFHARFRGMGSQPAVGRILMLSDTSRAASPMPASFVGTVPTAASIPVPSPDPEVTAELIEQSPLQPRKRAGRPKAAVIEDKSAAPQRPKLDENEEAQSHFVDDDDDLELDKYRLNVSYKVSNNA